MIEVNKSNINSNDNTTLRLYREDQYQIECQAIVIGIQERDGIDIISCDQSVFYPEGGGQPSDIGYVITSNKSVDIENVRYEITRAYDTTLEGEVWHVTNAPHGTFAIGDEVILQIDWDVRFTHMQRHLGEHMLSGTINTLFGGTNAGFHMGEDYITIDISHPDLRLLTDEELALAEKSVNEAIWANLRVTTTWFETYEDSLVMPVRKNVRHDGRVSIVSVWNEDNTTYDCIACCGTHPRSSAEVGLLAIYKSELNKGLTRIYFDCGRKAQERLAADSRLLSEVAKRYSCSTADLISRLDNEADSLSSLKARLANMTLHIMNEEKKKILDDICGSSHKSPLYRYSSELLSADELLKLGFSVIEELRSSSIEALPSLLIMTHPVTSTCLLLATRYVKCGSLVKEYAKEFGGKGGGRDDNARAIFESNRNMQDFVNLIDKVL